MLWQHGFGAGQWLLMSLLMLIFWLVVIAAVIYFLRAGRSPESSSGRTARQVLDERFASGEMTEGEYLHSRDLISK